MRTAPIGPSKGMPESISAAEAALMASTSWGLARSVPVIGRETEMTSATVAAPCRLGGRRPVPSRRAPGGGPVPGDWQLTRARRSWVVLAANAEAGDECPVPLHVVLPDVVEQPAATADEHEQATTAVVVLLVGLQVLGEVIDAPREERDLYLRRPGVGVVDAVLGDRRGFVGHAV